MRLVYRGINNTIKKLFMVSGFFSGGFDAFFFFSFTRPNVRGKKRLLHKTQDQFLLDGHIFSHVCDSLIEKIYIYEITESGNVAAQWRQAVFVCVCVVVVGVNK